jgi:hypothetical protein
MFGRAMTRSFIAKQEVTCRINDEEHDDTTIKGEDCALEDPSLERSCVESDPRGQCCLTVVVRAMTSSVEDVGSVVCPKKKTKTMRQREHTPEDHPLGRSDTRGIQVKTVS